MPQAAPVPFRQFVLKAHSRCDLACSYCYMYEHADQSWAGRTKVLSLETAALVGARVAEHALEHRLASVRFVLHGGEPLLAGVTRLEGIIRELEKALDGVAELDLRIHTNGVKLDRAFCDLFDRHAVKVGVSLDGDREANDRHRLYRGGRSSHGQVRQALELLRSPEYHHLYSGILCTIDIANDPIAVYEALLAEKPPRVDLLLPHSTWDVPPPRPADAPMGLGETPYADWLIAIHDRWIRDGRPMGIRIFDSISSTLRGGPALTEALGLAPSDVLVIETDGEIEQLDALKIAFEGAPSTGFSVLTDSLDAVLDHPGVRARQRGIDDLCQTCRACPVVSTCGGGLYPHRYRAETGFDNPSVYCEDLKTLILHIADTRTTLASVAGTEPRHGVEQSHLAELASGFGGEAAVRELSQVQASINRGLLATAAEALIVDDSSARTAWNLLEALDEAHGEALADVLSHPYFRAWAVRVLSTGPQAGDGCTLGSYAIATALAAGAEVDLALAPHRDSFHLPRLGRLLLDGTPSTLRVATTAKPGVVTVRIGTDRRSLLVDGSGPDRFDGWRSVGRVRSDGFELRLEDCDPERACHQWPVASQLSNIERKGWGVSFDEAWTLIKRDHAVYAPGLMAGLSTITPLRPSSSGHEISATARQAPGAVAAALPASPDRLALLLVHEFQHVKMGAVLDSYDLFDESDDRLYYAPWRDDPRPLEGLLQGTYAHVAVTDFWRVRRTVTGGSESESAEAQFARWRNQTAEAVEVLARSGSLTPLGLTFVDGMRATLAAWLAEPVDAVAEEAAQLSSAAHLAAHRARIADSAVV